MEVPFLSSGALSRAHYTLVRQVENAASLQAIDDIILAQVASIQKRFAGRQLSVVCPLSHSSPDSQPDRYLGRMQRAPDCAVVLRYDLYRIFSLGFELRTALCYKPG